MIEKKTKFALISKMIEKMKFSLLQNNRKMNFGLFAKMIKKMNFGLFAKKDRPGRTDSYLSARSALLRPPLISGSRPLSLYLRYFFTHS